MSPTLKSRLFASTELNGALAALAASAVLAPISAQAAGSGMPWEEPLPRVLESGEGPVAQIVAVLVSITTGLSIAFAASSFFLSFFSFGGGALVA